MAQESQDGVVDRPERERFETETEHGTAILTYERSDRGLALLHTEVPPAAEGRGVGSRLVKAALESARAEGLRVLPFCPFVKTYLERHPEYRDLADEG